MARVTRQARDRLEDILTAIRRIKLLNASLLPSEKARDHLTVGSL